jgi:hypothetical protein
MRRLALLTGLLFCGVIVVAGAGCSESTPPPAEPIKGMTPGEYREKAEMSREIQPKTPKTNAQSPK